MTELYMYWKTWNGDNDFDFYNQQLGQYYEDEQGIAKLLTIFATIAIFIGCLGLYGLITFIANQKTKEIGVRKVHGATVSQILILLTKDYSKLMLIAFTLAIPFGYYLTQNWLNNFEFRTVLDPLIFITAGVITFAIGVFTVATRSYLAATVNPVHSLKDE